MTCKGAGRESGLEESTPVALGNESDELLPSVSMVP
jgi:hypothetical protein